MSDRIADDLLEHMAKNSSQYDSTCRALAAELLELRARDARQSKLLHDLRVTYDINECDQEFAADGCGQCYACRLRELAPSGERKEVG